MDIEKISSAGLAAGSDRDRAAKSSSPPRPKQRHSSSVDGSGLFFSPGSGGGSAASLAAFLEAKKAMSPEQLAELAAINPKHAKRYSTKKSTDFGFGLSYKKHGEDRKVIQEACRRLKTSVMQIFVNHG